MRHAILTGAAIVALAAAAQRVSQPEPDSPTLAVEPPSPAEVARRLSEVFPEAKVDRGFLRTVVVRLPGANECASHLLPQTHAGTLWVMRLAAHETQLEGVALPNGLVLNGDPRMVESARQALTE